MTHRIILASGSKIRSELLSRAGLAFDVEKPRIDEESVKLSLQAEGVKPRDIADALAELKAEKVGKKNQNAFTIGCDQVLDLDGEMFSKPESPAQARDQLMKLAGKQHKLYSAAVIFNDGKPVWRHIGQVKMTMRRPSEAYLNSYIERNWPEIGFSCGGYQVEAEGSRLFSRIDGDFFSILGLPLLEILDYLGLRGAIEA